jgi:hypothetical protein
LSSAEKKDVAFDVIAADYGWCVVSIKVGAVVTSPSCTVDGRVPQQSAPKKQGRRGELGCCGRPANYSMFSWWSAYHTVSIARTPNVPLHAVEIMHRHVHAVAGAKAFVACSEFGVRGCIGQVEIGICGGWCSWMHWPG